MSAEWKQHYANVRISGVDVWPGFSEALEAKIREVERHLMREINYDLEYGSNTRHHPNQSDLAKIRMAERIASRGVRCLEELSGHGTVAWRRPR